MKNTTLQQWETDVIKSENPVLVDFWAAWCGPCQIVAPVFEQLSDEYKGKIDFVKVDVDKEQKLAAKYNISSIPTLAVFKSGEIVESKIGAATRGTIKQMIEKYKN